MDKVSLYVPCFNVEKYLDQCLEAVFKQSRPPDEVIVVDDGSSDNTVQIASRYPVRIERHDKNRGLAAARNTGIRASSHDLVASLDADCVADSRWLETMLCHMNGDSAAGIGGKLLERNRTRLPDRWRASHMQQHWGDEPVIDPHFLCGNNTLFRKTVLLEAGLYNERLRTNFEDVAMSESIRRLGYSLFYQPTAVVEHLRTDTIASVVRTNWKWRFYGYRRDITLRNTLAGILGHVGVGLRFLIVDCFKRDLSCSVLSCVATGYAILADLQYLARHSGERRAHE